MAYRKMVQQGCKSRGGRTFGNQDIMGCFDGCYFSYLVQYSNQMRAVSRKDSPASAKAGFPKGFEESTRIHHSHSTTLPHNRTLLPPSPTHPLPSKFHLCCSAIHTTPHPSFHPVIAPLPFQLYPQQQALSRSKQEQWQDITQDTRLRIMQRTEQKLQDEQDRLRECTFTPVITPFLLPSSDQEVHDKLYGEAERRRKQRMEAEAKEQQKKDLKMLRKQPDPSRWKLLNAEKFDLQPLYKRLEKVIEQKRRSRKMVAQKEQTSYPFHPQLSQQTNKINAGRKQRVQGVVDRLIADFSKREDRINLLKEGREAQMRKECTFAPAVNHYFPTDPVKGTKDRQTNHLDHPFAPVINPLSALITQDRKNESQEDRFFRMIQTPILRKAEAVEIVEAELYAECCFNPEINDISRHMHGGGQKHHICEFKQPESPTYRPVINQASRVMSEAKRAKSLENIKQKNLLKEEAYRKEMEYSQMRECTFRPRIKDEKRARVAIQTRRTLQDVAGVQMFLENREKYNDKLRVRKALEERLFQLQKNYDMRMQRKKQKDKNQC